MPDRRAISRSRATAGDVRSAAERQLLAPLPWLRGRWQAADIAETSCFAVERLKYRDVGGLESPPCGRLQRRDSCFRLQKRGYLNLLTPHAVLTRA